MIAGKAAALALDTGMCVMMYAIQRRHRLNGGSWRYLEEYIAACEPLSRDAYFAGPPLTLGGADFETTTLHWESPIRTACPENNRTHIDLIRCAEGWKAPTALMFHALMSASDRGYRQRAADFNARGWNACFVHLPYHYSRRPGRHANGELAITADLVRTAEGLRQGVAEARQLMAALREQGCREFGVWASSYGGWIGALLASVESDFRFVALMEPIVDVSHSIWVSPAGLALRRELVRQSIEPRLIERHFRLGSPMHGEPLCGGKKVVFCGGAYDRIAPVEAIARMHELWRGSELIEVAQGHFGYRMMPAVWTHLAERGCFE
jgi:pimeloyl-ACP methyl ester carboxylesterase